MDLEALCVPQVEAKVWLIGRFYAKYNLKRSYGEWELQLENCLHILLLEQVCSWKLSVYCNTCCFIARLSGMRVQDDDEEKSNSPLDKIKQYLPNILSNLGFFGILMFASVCAPCCLNSLIKICADTKSFVWPRGYYLWTFPCAVLEVFWCYINRKGSNQGTHTGKPVLFNVFTAQPGLARHMNIMSTWAKL